LFSLLKHPPQIDVQTWCTTGKKKLEKKMSKRYGPYGQKGREERRNALRVFCNWVKLRVLGCARLKASCDQGHRDVSRLLRTETVIPSEMLLDLGCGRGGDLHKWSQLGIAGVVGLDADADAVHGRNGAIERVKNARRKSPGSVPGFLAFGVCDCSNVGAVNGAIGNAVGVLDGGQDGLVDTLPFQIIATQFSLQYFFESRDKLQSLLTIVRDHLQPGGWWIGTSTLWRYSEWPEKGMCTRLPSFENATVKFTCSSSSSSAATDIYGRAVSFFMNDTVFFDRDRTEYLVDVDELKKEAARYGLEPRILTRFDNIIEDWPRKSTLSTDELETCEFYFAFAFERVSLE
jgi:SAM-dependent methyltransferase